MAEDECVCVLLRVNVQLCVVWLDISWQSPWTVSGGRFLIRCPKASSPYYPFPFPPPRSHSLSPCPLLFLIPLLSIPHFLPSLFFFATSPILPSPCFLPTSLSPLLLLLFPLLPLPHLLVSSPSLIASPPLLSLFLLPSSALTVSSPHLSLVSPLYPQVLSFLCFLSSRSLLSLFLLFSSDFFVSFFLLISLFPLVFSSPNLPLSPCFLLFSLLLVSWPCVSTLPLLVSSPLLFLFPIVLSSPLLLLFPCLSSPQPIACFLSSLFSSLNLPFSSSFPRFCPLFCFSRSLASLLFASSPCFLFTPSLLFLPCLLFLFPPSAYLVFFPLFSPSFRALFPLFPPLLSMFPIFRPLLCFFLVPCLSSTHRLFSSDFLSSSLNLPFSPCLLSFSPLFCFSHFLSSLHLSSLPCSTCKKKRLKINLLRRGRRNGGAERKTTPWLLEKCWGWQCHAWLDHKYTSHDDERWNKFIRCHMYLTINEDIFIQTIHVLWYF